MPDVEKVIEALDLARRGLNDARNAAEEWRRGKVADIDFTPGQFTALRSVFRAGIQAGEAGIAAVKAELANQEGGD